MSEKTVIQSELEYVDYEIVFPLFLASHFPCNYQEVLSNLSWLRIGRTQLHDSGWLKFKPVYLY